MIGRLVDRMARCVSLGLLVVLSACDSPSATRPAAAYDPTTLTGGLLYRWPSGKTVRVYVVPSVSSRFDLGTATRQAMVVWNAVSQFGEFTLETAPTLADADLVVFDRDTPMPVRAGSCTFDARSASGYTYFCPDVTTPSRAERLQLSAGGLSAITVAIQLDRGRVASQDALNAVVAHEFGHALGIGAHSDDARDLMFGLPTVSAPSARDRGTLRFVLGQRAQLTL
jgi:predicted Zn-dependent protease